MKTAFEISLFPIQGSVSLPFSEVTLHVFEPRYRKMVKDSVDQKRRIGVAHTKREISPAKNHGVASKNEQLNNNQETYEAHSIFSAGFAEIIETLPDGRMVILITMDNRYEISEELQQIPYTVVRCTLYEDDIPADEKSERAREALDRRLQNLKGPGTDQLGKYVLSPEWTAVSTLTYSFKIYSLVRFDANVMQSILEMKSATARITFLKDALTGMN